MIFMQWKKIEGEGTGAEFMAVIIASVVHVSA